MTGLFFVYGLAFFSLGLAVLLEGRRTSALVLSRHLPWLAAFALTHSLVEWVDMFLLMQPAPGYETLLMTARTLLLPGSAVLLVRFGVGLLGEAGPLPDWLTLAPPALVVPAALVFAYALVVAVTDPQLGVAAEVWSRYLLYFPGCVLAALGFIRQGRRLPQPGLDNAGQLLFGAAVAFGFNAIVGGLIVPPAPYGLAPWLNNDTAFALSGVPVQAWRALSAFTVTVLVIRALGVFEAERKEQLERLRAAGEAAQQAALQAQFDARRTAEDWTNTLVNINRSVANIEAVDEVLPNILKAAQRLLNADVAALALWDESGERLVIKAHFGGAVDRPLGAIHVVDPVINQAVRQGRPLRVPQDAPGRWVCPVLGREIQSACIVPLLLNGQSLGGLWVAREFSREFNLADVIGLEHLADQAVIAIEHALMAARLQTLAVVEERSRIAREMHDGLSQVLGYLSLQTQTLEVLVRRGDCDAALGELRQARAHIHEAQADVREGILSLRTTLSGQESLVTALNQYVDEFEVQTGIQSVLVTEIEGQPRLAPLAEAQIMRIVQEALTNVRKHASAPRVQVHLRATDGHLHVTVADDGCGFSPQAVAGGHFGLQTMRERAESVGGSLLTHSVAGEGTQVEVWLPLVQP